MITGAAHGQGRAAALALHLFPGPGGRCRDQPVRSTDPGRGRIPYPAAGGFYKIFSHCHHPAFAFMVNWISIIANTGSSASVAIMGAEYINPLILPGVEPETAPFPVRSLPAWRSC
jgi:hypothetical protein